MFLTKLKENLIELSPDGSLKISFDDKLVCDFWHIIKKEFKGLETLLQQNSFHSHLIVYETNSSIFTYFKNFLNLEKNNKTHLQIEKS